MSYRIARLMLIVAVGLMLFSLVVIGLSAGMWGLAGVAVVLACLFRKEAAQLTSHGSARWAREEEVENG